jgi:MFS family permease
MDKLKDQRAEPRFAAYEYGLAVLMGLTFGLVSFDRGAINFLSPFIVADLKLSYAQLGVAASALSLTWAVAGFLVGRASDAAGRRKPYLIAAVVAFSLCSAASGLAGGFLTLVAIRLLMGLAEGPVAPLANTILLGASGEHRRGLNNGIMGVSSNLLGAAAAPIVLVGLASAFGWRAAFFLAGLPGLALAVVIALAVREASGRASAAKAVPLTPPLQLLRVRNIALSAAIASLLLAFLSVGVTFLPLYLVQVRRLSVIDMGLVMSALGIMSLVAALGVPTLSDRLGRKPVLAGLGLVGAGLPLGGLLWSGGVAGLAAILAVSMTAAALLALAIIMVPAESVDPRDRGAALGIVMGIAELVGGFAAPPLAGLLANRAGLGAALIVAGACAVGAALLSLALTETAPRRIARLGLTPIVLEAA